MTPTGTGSWIRETAVAGTFYPKGAGELRALLAEYCDIGQAKKRATAIVVPHAGYIYSGAIAGEAFGRVQLPRCAIVVCPNHSGYGAKISVWGRGAWETPLGEIEVEEETADTFLHKARLALLDQNAHLYEHAIEVQLPFLQYLRPDIKIVPIVLGPLRMEECLEVGKALAETVKSAPAGECLLVASTDMSHYLPAEEAEKEDKPALEAIEELNPSELYRTVAENEISMCGFIPTTAVLEAAHLLGAQKSKILRYGHSGEISRDFKRVVAYAAAFID